MPSPEALQRFIAEVEANAHVEAIEEFYALQRRCKRTSCRLESDEKHLSRTNEKLCQECDP